jgi:hypothetical protein
MGRKDFPGSELMIAREPRMCPPQVSHSQSPKVLHVTPLRLSGPVSIPDGTIVHQTHVSMELWLQCQVVSPEICKRISRVCLQMEICSSRKSRQLLQMKDILSLVAMLNRST